MAQEENKESAKGAFIEKLLFALLPLLIGSTGYLIQALGSIQHDVTILNQKVSLVVTTDNKQASNSGAELALKNYVKTWKKKFKRTVMLSWKIVSTLPFLKIDKVLVQRKLAQ